MKRVALGTFDCEDCKVRDYTPFMVSDSLWVANAADREFLCLACFEKRLGRRVGLSDLQECLYTRVARLGAMLAARENENEQIWAERIRTLGKLGLAIGALIGLKHSVPKNIREKIDSVLEKIESE